MKKTVLLLGIFSLSVLMSKAQFSPTGFIDDFVNATEYTNVHWSNVDTTKNDFYATGNKVLVYQFVRNTSLKELDLTVNQPKATYNDLEITFGKTATGATRTIDLSNNATYYLSVENGVSSGSITANEIQAMLYIVDSSGNTIDHDSQGYKNSVWDTQAWVYSIAAVLGEGEAKIIQKGTLGYGTPPTVLTGTFKDGFFMDYSTYQAGPPEVPGTYKKNCDLSKIARVRIRINHSTFDMQDQPVYIHKITIGNYVPAGINEINNTKESLKIYPNPVTNGIVNFSEEVKNIYIFNNQGSLVKNIERAKTIDVSDLSSGIYFVNTSKGQSKFIIK